jgi:hypothetical protein
MTKAHEYVEANVGQTREAGEPQSKKPCAECHHYREDLTKEPCWTCYANTNKPSWRKHETGNNESEEVGCENCFACGKNLSS